MPTRKAPSKVAPRRASTRARNSQASRNQSKKWSSRVTETSDAMDLEGEVFKRTPRAIAASLKRSAERSHRRKSPPYRSAMSMLTFYINRGGRNLSPAQRTKLEKAKDELRRLFGKAPRKHS
ncbi:MAG TPA: DUF3175 domain-containing protein [Polyangiaceae bacterium]|nr:DUF3175 domain-containing protein [Polyangiaceae bacterium]